MSMVLFEYLFIVVKGHATIPLQKFGVEVTDAEDDINRCFQMWRAVLTRIYISDHR